MKSTVRLFVLAAIPAALSLPLFAASSSAIGDVVRAQIIIGKVMQVVDKYRQFTIELEAPQPIANNTGKYLLPYKADGEVTEWASKALNAQAGKLAGEKAGDLATRGIASKVPLGGLAGGLIKKKTKEMGAVAAIGGMDYIKKTSECSFASLNEYAVYLHVRHSSDSNYKEILAAAMAVYPDLEGRFDGAIQDAYRTQAAKAGKKID